MGDHPAMNQTGAATELYYMHKCRDEFRTFRLVSFERSHRSHNSVLSVSRRFRRPDKLALGALSHDPSLTN